MVNSSVLKAVIILSFVLNTVTAYAVRPEWHDYQKKSSNFLLEYAEYANNCIKKKDTNHSVFHGCIDWHSAVHAHWALLRAYRKTKTPQFLHAVFSSIDIEEMKTEQQFLSTNLYFEMPYGRAWFLKFVCEYEIVTGRKDLRYFAESIASSLHKYLISNDFNPNIREYGNLSWAILNLLEFYEHTSSKERIEILKRHIGNSNKLRVDLNDDFGNADFFSVWGNLAYLQYYLLDNGEYKNWLAKHNFTKEKLSSVKTIKSNHHLGINFSRAWGFGKAYKKTGDLKFKIAYVNSMYQGFSLHQKYKSDYHAYGHWVPQFGILAITSVDY